MGHTRGRDRREFASDLRCVWDVSELGNGPGQRSQSTASAVETPPRLDLEGTLQTPLALSTADAAHHVFTANTGEAETGGMDAYFASYLKSKSLGSRPAADAAAASEFIFTALSTTDSHPNALTFNAFVPTQAKDAEAAPRLTMSELLTWTIDDAYIHSLGLTAQSLHAIADHYTSPQYLALRQRVLEICPGAQQSTVNRFRRRVLDRIIEMVQNGRVTASPEELSQRPNPLPSTETVAQRETEE